MVRACFPGEGMFSTMPKYAGPMQNVILHNFGSIKLCRRGHHWRENGDSHHYYSNPTKYANPKNP